MICISISQLRKLRLSGPKDTEYQSWDLSPTLSDWAKLSALQKAESISVCEEFYSCITTLGMET